ncbi:MAG: single-stranded-DNA-specific exonuclease RecJ [Proteobacteria bacterium]|nr:single-stranded-DNA-specific exonuclease RecJ [Pseudomonadota bacterium]MBU1739051.1 single-stranded-DNA-specific exonuclease RecJ [Pseudomonadota bacterium]
MSHSGNWKILADHVDDLPEAGADSALPSLAEKLLALRGITGEAARIFLNPTLAQLPVPDTLHGLKPALDLLINALERKIQVVIYGDYDADGTTATALLATFMKHAGFRCSSYIPDRLTEGYSLNRKALAELKNRYSPDGANGMLLVTVDCGISNHQEVDEARAMGYSVIITDHHRPSETIPEADAVINPHLPECAFPFTDLAGVGVAFYLIAGLRARLKEIGCWQDERQPNLKEYLDLVAIGTVADMVPLTGANRILVKAGLEMIRNSPRPGIKALLKKANITPGSVSAESISFHLAPRLNAAGRIGTPLVALELLMAENPLAAEGNASLLEEANQQRRSISDEIFADACVAADQQLAGGERGLVLASRNWHKGMLGLVASRMVSKYDHPTILFTIEEDGTATGSGRSVSGLDIHTILENMSEMLIRFGGHKAAVGISIHEENIDLFRERFHELVHRQLQDRELKPPLTVDLRASFEDVFDPAFLDTYKKMEPFGFDNPQPIFCCSFDAGHLKDIKGIGNGSIRLRYEGESVSVNSVGFGKADLFSNLTSRSSINLAYKITLNEFRGISNWEARIEDAEVFNTSN